MLIYSKKLPLGTTIASWQLWNLLQAFLMVSFFKLVNAAVILASVSSFELHSFVGLLLNCAQHIIIWGFRRPDVRGDVVTEIFSWPRLSSPACVAWCRFLSNTEFSSSHLFNPAKPPPGAWCIPPCKVSGHVRWMGA